MASFHMGMVARVGQHIASARFGWDWKHLDSLMHAVLGLWRLAQRNGPRNYHKIPRLEQVKYHIADRYDFAYSCKLLLIDYYSVGTDMI